MSVPMTSMPPGRKDGQSSPERPREFCERVKVQSIDGGVNEIAQGDGCTQQKNVGIRDLLGHGLERHVTAELVPTAGNGGAKRK